MILKLMLLLVMYNVQSERELMETLNSARSKTLISYAY